VGRVSNRPPSVVKAVGVPSSGYQSTSKKGPGRESGSYEDAEEWRKTPLKAGFNKELGT